MSIHVALHHRTRYTYDRPVSLGPQVVRLRPAPHCRTRIVGYSLNVEPKPHFLNWQQDPQSNYLARLVFPEKTTEFSVTVDVVVEMAVYNPFDFFLEPEAEKFPFEYDHILDHELEPFRLKGELSPQFRACLADIRTDILGAANDWKPGQKVDKRLRTIDFLVAVNQKLAKDISYLIRMEPGVQTPEETLVNRSGSCRDSAWLLCQLMRHCGLAARFVSGYLIQLAPDQKSLDGPSGPEKDFTDLHAWCEVYLPGAGWVGMDATSGMMASEGHIPLACAPDPISAAAITGGVDESEVTFDFDMRITRVHESPRVSKPYTEEQWTAIDALGQRVEADLQKHDVRLTMGGEPTFVSIDDLDGAEWNSVAVGPMKGRLADQLLRRLQTRFAPGAFLHHGQGKWYPGEQLPRWSYGCYWRKDGQPLWDDVTLFADVDKNYGMTSQESARFIEALSARLDVDPKWVLPGYEDSYYYLWREKRLPMNVDPLESNLEDPLERDRLARVFSAGLESIVGHALPLKRESAEGKTAWASGPWFLRHGRMHLTPGDSAMGLRLPLEGLPFVSKKDYPYIYETDPLAPRPPLPTRPAYDPQLFVRAGIAAGSGAAGSSRGLGLSGLGQAGSGEPEAGEKKTGDEADKDAPSALRDDGLTPPVHGKSTPETIRTALCVEARDGRLHVFMPPVEKFDDYLDLLSAVEDTARHLQMEVLIEGYTPPYDPRVHVLKVTPDPGVIEVNVQPAESWSEMVNNTSVLYEEARNVRLGTEKFMVDGRHTGTGGGNHIVLGGATPADSPLLRRPDLLRSLLTYWQNHPALSYLFSGLFIGPTSQAPRIDEARNDSLYELEVAFKQIPAFGAVPPWLVDRIFRHLLIDTTGNTHRAEFCIDKLYSPDSSTGRLGLLELRAFEMPPHHHMSLAQQLLLRSLVARFWQEPYAKPLVRWGTDIHDRWMLPHFIWQDLQDITGDLQAFGYPVEADWFAPHQEFRFPFVGDYDVRGLHIEFRHALEPWHVLGEEGSAGGTVRFVDSSVERLQVKVTGAIGSRHVILCNGRALPLQPTGVNGEFVAAVRYRAWQPGSCLHPTVPVQSPLTFDVVDTWNDRAIGGCSYHVVHPGGLSYTTFPVNAFEAESRRLSRFFRYGHTGGKLVAEKPVVNPQAPWTLDLRAM